MRSTPEVCRPSRSHPPPARRAWLAVGFVVLLALALPPRSGLAAPEVYFSPGGGIRDRLLRQINLTKASIDLAIFDLTSGELAGALMAARARVVAVRIVADARQARGKQSEIPVLLTSGIDV